MLPFDDVIVNWQHASQTHLMLQDGWDYWVGLYRSLSTVSIQGTCNWVSVQFIPSHNIATRVWLSSSFMIMGLDIFVAVRPSWIGWDNHMAGDTANCRSCVIPDRTTATRLKEYETLYFFIIILYTPFLSTFSIRERSCCHPPNPEPHPPNHTHTHTTPTHTHPHARSDLAYPTEGVLNSNDMKDCEVITSYLFIATHEMIKCCTTLLNEQLRI